MMYGYGGHMAGWGYALMTVTTVLLWILLVIGIIALTRHLGQAGQRGSGPAGPPARPTPHQLLAERFARGDIDGEEYRRCLDMLKAGEDATGTAAARTDGQ